MTVPEEIDQFYHRIPVRGETVAATRYRSADAETTQPALLMYTPYHKDDYEIFGGYLPFVWYLCRRGYDVVVADIVGTGASSGTKAKPFDAEEGQEATAIIEWIADREWNSGVVGMFGKSYSGTAALKAAAEDPDPLEAIVAIHAPWRLYDWGALDYFGAISNWCNLMHGLQAMPPTRRDKEGRWHSVWRSRLDSLRDLTPWQLQFLEHPTNDDYWESMAVDINSITTPTFAVSGWRDGFPNSTVEYFEAIDAPKRLLLGPWRHVMPHRGRERPINFRQQVADWFDQFLKPESDSDTVWPEVMYWTENKGGGIVDAGSWQEGHQWPKAPSSEHAITLHYTNQGLSFNPPNGDAPVNAGIDIDHTVGVDSLERGPPTDTTPDDHRSLSADTEPFDRSFVLTGTPQARVAVANQVAQVSVRLIDVGPNGEGRLLSHGTVTPVDREGAGRPRDQVRDDAGRLIVPMKARSHVVEPDHCLRLSISAGYFPVFKPTIAEEPIKVTSEASTPTYIEIPGQYQNDPLPSTVDNVGYPITDPPPISQAITHQSNELSVSRERIGDSVSMTSDSLTQISLPHGQLTVDRTVTAGVTKDDPQSRRVSAESTFEVTTDRERVIVQTDSHLRPHISRLATTVTVDDVTIFEETWGQ